MVDKLIGNDPDSPDYRQDYPMKIQLYELCLLALLIPFVFIKNIKHLAPFSMLANIASLAGLGFICEYMCCRKAPIWSRAAYVLCGEKGSLDKPLSYLSHLCTSHIF